MVEGVRDLLDRLASDEAFADVYFADPNAWLETTDLPAEEREALRNLDRDAVGYLATARDVEPPRAEEHPKNRPGQRHLTLWLGLWGCVAYIGIWIVLRTFG